MHIIKNNPLDPLAYGWVMFRKMYFILLSMVGTGDDVTNLSKTIREAVNVITSNFFDLSNKHSLVKPLSGPWFLALMNQAVKSHDSPQLGTLVCVLGCAF